jgi:hypothetical protein
MPRGSISLAKLQKRKKQENEIEQARRSALERVRSFSQKSDGGGNDSGNEGESDWSEYEDDDNPPNQTRLQQQNSLGQEDEYEEVEEEEEDDVPESEAVPGTVYGPVPTIRCEHAFSPSLSC